MPGKYRPHGELFFFMIQKEPAMVSGSETSSLWEKQTWEGVWPYLDPMDSVCLRTASME